MRDLLEKKKIVVYEVVPQRGVDQSKCFKLCDDMIDAGVDMIAITDMPTSRVKISPWAVGKELVNENVEVLIHFTRTSRNILRIESDLLGIYALGLKNILILSGDHPSGGDYPNATYVNDISTEDLIRLVKKLNLGLTWSGKKLTGKTDFFVGGVFNANLEKEIERAEEKIKAGADFLISQPIYCAKNAEKAADRLNVPFLVSIAFFSSEKQLKYFSSIPGIDIPNDLIEKLHGKDKSYIEDYTFDHILEVVEKLYNHVSGFYISGIVKNPEKVRRLVEFVEGLQGRS